MMRTLNYFALFRITMSLWCLFYCPFPNIALIVSLFIVICRKELKFCHLFRVTISNFLLRRVTHLNGKAHAPGSHFNRLLMFCTDMGVHIHFCIHPGSQITSVSKGSPGLECPTHLIQLYWWVAASLGWYFHPVFVLAHQTGRYTGQEATNWKRYVCILSRKQNEYILD